ncbi:MAG TPA: exodeoxyribonuclease VII large subunit [Candidatus Dormibacteraeota bacterium]|nr:exodeoxyribonuclease VII large subunit [Candidatus Dormibacteraeota bacterium]
MRHETGTILAVGEIARYVRRLIEGDERLQQVTVSGELSNFKGVHANGNAYFDLKDGQALLNCVMWGSTGLRLPKDLANGLQVHAKGRLSTYPGRSTYQLVVDELLAVGRGDLYARYEELRERLQREGLFALERKRAVPAYPRRIAVVTSPAAAAYADFMRTMRAHAPHVAVVLVETPVQGREAAAGIAAALDRASRLDVEAIALIRGGGSFEDLFAFNEETVVRAVAGAGVPVVTGIGHESDVTLADFAADLREPTPTAAARAIAPSRRELLERVERLRARLGRVRLQIVDERRQRLDYALGDVVRGTRQLISGERQGVSDLEGRLVRRSPRARLATARGRFTAVERRLRDGGAAAAAGRGRLLAVQCRLLERYAPRLTAGFSHRLAAVRGRLSALDPEAVLQRGYALVTSAGKVVRDAAAVPVGDLVEARLARGTLVARVERSEHG